MVKEMFQIMKIKEPCKIILYVYMRQVSMAV